jgi:hypothetical protein
MQIVVTRRPQFNFNNGWTPGVIVGATTRQRLVVSTPMDGLLYPYEAEVLVVSADELAPLLKALKEES